MSYIRQKFFIKSGMAIVVALAFIVGLFILITGIWMMQRNVTTTTRLTLQNQQALFAARAAMQHILVKAKYLPTELYDAIAFVTGKNPMFSFSEYSLETVRPNYFAKAKDDQGMELGNFYALYSPNGNLVEPDRRNRPRYVYHQISTNPPLYIRLGSHYNLGYRFLSKDILSDDPRKRYIEADPTKLDALAPQAVREKFLRYFLKDCNNLLDVQPRLCMQRKPGATPKTWSLERDAPVIDTRNVDPAVFPYTASYTVVSIELAAMKELRRYGEEAIKISVIGEIKDFQDKVYISKQEKTQKITRMEVIP